MFSKQAWQIFSLLFVGYIVNPCVSATVMDKTFASALRHSRLASFDRKLAQVYTTSKNCKRSGEWGLKRSLPTVVRTPYITVSDLDTTEHQTPWQSGTSQVYFVKRWKENFGGSKRPVPRKEHVEYNVATMTAGEFKHYVKRMSKRANEFQAKIANKELVDDQVFEYIGAIFDTDDNRQRLVGPTYSDYTMPYGYPVQGRILNAVDGGYAVGVGGVVAFLPKSSAVNLRRSGDKSVRTFYVSSTEFDAHGRPRVTLRLHQPITASSIISSSNTQSLSSSTSVTPIPTYSSSSSLSSSSSSESEQDKDRFGSMFLTSSEDPNPNHQELMQMFSELMKKK